MEVILINAIIYSLIEGNKTYYKFISNFHYDLYYVLPL